MIRIQDERQQRVITTGPYAIVRHPMYAGAGVYMIGMPLLLGSWLGLLILPLILGALTLRIFIEEAVLRKDRARQRASEILTAAPISNRDLRAGVGLTRSVFDQVCAGALQPSVDRRLDEGQERKVSDVVIRIERSVFFSWTAMDSTCGSKSLVSSSSHRWRMRGAFDENRARFGSHRAHRSGLLALPLNDLAPSDGGRRRPGNDQDAIRSVSGHPFGKLNLPMSRDGRDAPDGRTRVEVEAQDDEALAAASMPIAGTSAPRCLGTC